MAACFSVPHLKDKSAVIESVAMVLLHFYPDAVLHFTTNLSADLLHVRIEVEYRHVKSSD